MMDVCDNHDSAIAFVTSWNSRDCPACTEISELRAQLEEKDGKIKDLEEELAEVE